MTAKPSRNVPGGMPRWAASVGMNSWVTLRGLMRSPPDDVSDGKRASVSRRLIVTADDVGLDQGMTEGAIRAQREGIVTACSIVANGRQFDDAVAKLR